VFGCVEQVDDGVLLGALANQLACISLVIANAVAIHLDFALCRVNFTGHAFEQRRLTCSICSQNYKTRIEWRIKAHALYSFFGSVEAWFIVHFI